MNTNGLYIGGQFVSFSDAKASKPNLEQIASRGTVSGFQSLNSVLPNPDPILKKMGKDIQVYKDLKAEGGVRGCLRRRKAATKTKAWRIVQDESSTEITDRINAIFKNLQMNKIIGGMIDAAYYGYQPCEIIWSNANGAWIPADIKVMPADWFFFDPLNQLRFKHKNAGTEGLLVEPRKYLVPTQDATYENPYGEPDAASIFWATTFKLGGLEFWVRFTEKYGSPWVIGKYGNNYTPDKQQELLDNLYAMVQDAVAVIPDNSKIEIIEAAGKSHSADVYERFLKFCRSEVNIALLGQNQSTELESNHASATAGAEVAAEISDGDCEMITEQLQLLINWIVDYNWAGAPPQFEFFDDSNGGKEQAERDSKLYAAGARFSNQYYTREYGLQDGDLLEQTVQENQSVNFAEYRPAPQDFANHHTQTVAMAAQKPVDLMIHRIKTLVDQYSDFTELQQALLAEFSELDSSEIVNVMQTAMTFAELSGRAEVLDE